MSLKSSAVFCVNGSFTGFVCITEDDFLIDFSNGVISFLPSLRANLISLSIAATSAAFCLTLLSTISFTVIFVSVETLAKYGAVAS